MMKLNYKKPRKGVALVISMFVAIIAAIITIAMMGMSDTNTAQISDNRSGLLAYYAAEAGLEDVKNYFAQNSDDMGKALSLLALPDSSNKVVLDNNAKYWVDSLTYESLNSVAVVEIVGNYQDAFRKIRVKLKTGLPSYYNDYGLLTNGVVGINGNKTLKMSIHGNGGLDLKGPNNMENNAVATQSIDQSAGAPDSVSNPVGGYVPEVAVPVVPIEDLKVTSQEDSIYLNINQSDLMEQINNAPAGSKIYISGNLAQNPSSNLLLASLKPKLFLASVFLPNDYILIAKKDNDNGNSNNNSLTLSGDMEGKLIFVDGDITINANGLNDLSNVMIVSSGKLTVNGSVDIGTAHQGYIDVVFACQNDITLNGSKEFHSLFWTNGEFRQNGSSISGKVIAQTGIQFNGKYTLEKSNYIYPNDFMDKSVTVASWQQVAMD